MPTTLPSFKRFGFDEERPNCFLRALRLMNPGASGIFRVWLRAALALCLLLQTAGPRAAETARLKVVTTILPVYCFAANVAGNLADVENLIPGGVGPHDYQLSPGDLKKLSSARIVVANGLGLEQWLEKSIRNSVHPDRPLLRVECATGLSAKLIRNPGGPELSGGDHDHEHDKDAPNPHIWLDPRLAAHAVTNILISFQKADPTNAEGYRRNAEAFIARLEKLTAEYEPKLAKVRTNAFVTFHDAFPYFARRFALNLVGILEKVPDVAPSPRYMGELLALIREKKVRVIFTEPQFPSRLARQIAKDTNIAVAELDTLEAGPLRPAAYEEGMRRNLETIVGVLRSK